MSHDDDAEIDAEIAAFRRYLARLREDHERTTLEVVTAALEGMPPTTDVPMPNTAHPALERYAAGVRAWIEQHGPGPIRVPVLRSPRAVFTRTEAAPTEPIRLATWTLTPTRCVGLAPFVGDPRTTDARYFWTAMTDDLGRTITTDATLIYRGSDPAP